MRGVYRHFEETAGGDVWRARVEIALGQWVDVEQAAYERDGLQPSFWALPLEDDYLNSVLADPIADAQYGFEKDVMQPDLLFAMGAGAVFFVLLIAYFVIFGAP